MYVRTPFPARAPPALLQAACTRISSLLSCRDSFMSLVLFLPARLRNLFFLFLCFFEARKNVAAHAGGRALNSAEKSVFGSQGQLAPETRKTWPRAFLLHHHHHTTQFKPHLMGRANRTSYPRWWPQLSNERHARLLDSWVWWFAHILQGKQNETEQGGAIYLLWLPGQYRNVGRRPCPRSLEPNSGRGPSEMRWGGGGGSGSVTCETVRQRVAFCGVGVIFCDAWKADHEGQEG
jgi:hypothetical protein